MNSSGYLHPLYAQSLAEFGEPFELPASRGWLLRRPIAGTPFSDAMGCYPIFACEDWSCLGQDLDAVGKELVAVSLVTDPFGSYTQAELKQWFQDIASPYKDHFVTDLRQPRETFVASHHRRNAHKALKTVRVEVEPDPLPLLDEWTSLYDHLIERHGIRGIARFSHAAFDAQLRVPGAVAFRAQVNGQTAGMVLWYVQGEAAYYHLGAYSPEGYESNASFALFWTALDHFAAKGLRWLSLGAGAGAHGDGTDGLTRFKRGWSTGTRTAYFCGRIFNRDAYQRLLAQRGIESVNYFPAYRLGEFA